MVSHRCGAEVRLMAPLGRDGDGDWAAAGLAAEGLDASSLLRVVGTDRPVADLRGAGRREHHRLDRTRRQLGDSGTCRRSTSEAQLRGDWLMMQGNLPFRGHPGSARCCPRGRRPDAAQSGAGALAGVGAVAALRRGGRKPNRGKGLYQHRRSECGARAAGRCRRAHGCGNARRGRCPVVVGCGARRHGGPST